MYSIYFDSGPPKTKLEEGASKNIFLSNGLYLNRICVFEPQGGDVYAA
jgi:hypothetical protein